jgi:hypothetical protein
VRIAGRLLRRRAIRIQDPDESRQLLEEVSRQRGVDSDFWRTDVWFFRMDRHRHCRFSYCKVGPTVKLQIQPDTVS